MTVWKAKKIFMYSYAGVGVLFSAVILIFALIPNRYVDAVVDDQKKVKDTKTSAGESSNLMPAQQFRDILETADTSEPEADPDTVIKKPELPPNFTPAEQWKTRAATSIKLNGTYLSDDPKSSFAAVSWLTDEEQFYGPGETIINSDGIALKNIYSDYIEVEKNGGVLKIELQKMDTAADTRPSARDRKHGSRNVPPPLPGARTDRNFHKNPLTNTGARNPLKPRKIGSNKYLLSRDDMKPYLERPDKLLTEMSVKPQTENGEPTGGYIITGLKQEALLRKVGLRDGDVILRVNGQHPMSLMNVINDKSLREVQVEYLRAGRRQTLHYTIQN